MAVDLRRGLIPAAAMALSLALPTAARAVELLYLSDNVPGGLDVDGPTSSAPSTQMGIANLLEPLVYYKVAGETNGVKVLDLNQFEGRLAESWSYDEATLTWTFKLRRNVKGCGGVTFTADDVIYSLLRAKSVSGAAAVSWLGLNIASFAGFTSAVFGNSPEAQAAKQLKDSEFRKVDDYTVEIRQSAPNKLFLPVLAQFTLHVYDKETMEARATPADPYAHDYANNVGAPGFGPYCLDRWQKDKEFVLTANPDYYRGKPAIDRVVVNKVAQSSQRMVLVRSNTAQLVDRLTPKEFAALRDDKNIVVVAVPSNSTTFLNLNWKREPWSNVKFREAIAYAIPYDSVIRNVYFGQSTKYDGVVPSIYPDGFKPPAPRGYDLAKARAALAEAGFPEGKGLDKHADTLKLSYATESEGVLGPAATIIQSELRKIGVPIVLNPIPQSQLVDRALVKRDLEFMLNDFSKSIVIDAGFAMQVSYVSRDRGGVANYSNYANPEFDDLFLTKAKVEPDPKKRTEYLAQLQQMLVRDVAIAPIAENKLMWAMSPKLKGIAFHPEQALRFYDLRLEN